MEPRQCWAHHSEGHRCQKRATHRGDHAWSVTWTDDQSHPPVVAKYAPVQPVSEPPPPVVEKKGTRCVACGHPHEGECRCGCREFIG